MGRLTTHVLDATRVRLRTMPLADQAFIDGVPPLVSPHGSSTYRGI
jgi:5-hydroxyisourate hydrolase-like protein (transthyretin family)